MGRRLYYYTVLHRSEQVEEQGDDFEFTMSAMGRGKCDIEAGGDRMQATVDHFAGLDLL
jgi:hypothetical protein